MTPKPKRKRPSSRSSDKFRESRNRSQADGVNAGSGADSSSPSISILLAAGVAVILLGALAWWIVKPSTDAVAVDEPVNSLSSGASPILLEITPPVDKPALIHNWLYCWAEQPEELKLCDPTRTSFSNIAPDDYVKPATCSQCHEEQFQLWSDSPHAKMNATASDESVVGNFDDGSIEYDGGVMRTFRDDGEYFMQTRRGERQRTYQITRTIGSRFFQYYVGRVVAGDPLPGQAELTVAEDHPLREIVLPFGYWIKNQEWLPIYDVHEFMDQDDVQTSDDNPYDAYGDYRVKPYYFHCGRCHTTMPEGYRMLWDENPRAFRKPQAHFSLWAYLDETLAEMAPQADPQPKLDDDGLGQLVVDVGKDYGPDRAAALGVSCESCHYGGREHAESEGKIKPRFIQSSPHLSNVNATSDSIGRTFVNVNLSCSKCHSAFRRQLPSGEIHKNSAEFLDAMQGSCYSQAKCTSCHDPHAATGLEWPKTPLQDDQSCIACHGEFDSDQAIAAHTHHPIGSSGSRCMNCHMPKVTEGLQDLVRSHRIDSPSRPESFNQGGVNACNLCHLDKSLGWSMNHLTDWYGKRYDHGAVAKASGSIDQPAGRLWLSGDDDYVRLVAIGAVKRERASWLLPELTNSLDGRLLINRQFAVDTIESLLEIDLSDTGYEFWKTPSERTKALLDQARQSIQSTAASQKL